LIHDRVIFQKSVFGFLYSYSIFLESFRVIDGRYSEFLTIGLLFLCSVLSGFFFIFDILAYFWSDIKYAVQREFYYKAVLSGQYYLASFEDLCNKKGRRYLCFDHCSVDL